MAVAAAEQTLVSQQHIDVINAIGQQVLAEQQLVSVVPELRVDYESRAKANRFIGACLADRTVQLDFAETALRTQPIESLYDAIQLAAEGDETARKMIEINVATDVIERTTKSGHIMEVTLSLDEAGRIQQFGQTMESVHANSLRYASATPQMLARSKAEALNAFRIADLHASGQLEDYNFVVFSRAADDMSLKAMQNAGFFTDTMSMAIQVTSANGDTLKTESAFVAGKRTKDAERHDGSTMAAVGRQLGADLDNLTATELLATSLLVHKSVMPGGVVDVVRMYDQAAGTFFGEDRPAEDYDAYRAECREREARFKPKVETITEALVAEAPTIRDRVHATSRLHQLSQWHMVQQAIGDESINPAVFGPAAENIIVARTERDSGDATRFHEAVRLALQNAKSSSCPTAIEAANAEAENGEQSKNDESGDCEFISKKCPECGAKNVKTTVSKGVIKGDCGCKAKLG